MRRSLLPALVPLIALGLLTSAAPVASAPAGPTRSAPSAPAVEPLQKLVVRTVTIRDRRVRFVLAVDGAERGFVQMKFRRDGRWRTVAIDRTDCNYYDGSHDPFLQVQKPDKQVFVGWTGPGEDPSTNYGGYSVRHRTITMYDSDECSAAG